VTDEITDDTTMGFTAENNNVTGIELWNYGLSALPESIENLKSLENLNIKNSLFARKSDKRTRKILNNLKKNGVFYH